MPSQDRSLPGGLTREQQLARTFVDLADTLAASFDVHEFLSLLCGRTQQILAVEAAGVLVEAETGELGLVAASSETTEAIDLFEAQAREGPCFEAYRDGTQVLEEDLTTARSRWPGFVPRAREAGFGAVLAVPLRLGEYRLGAMNLFRSQTGVFAPADVSAAQALADLATIALVGHRERIDAEELTAQLQYALKARVVIEQAKGMLAHHYRVEPEEAFELLRWYARPRSLEVRQVAEQVVAGELSVDQLE